MVYSSYGKIRMLHHYYKGHRPYTIQKMVEKEGIKASRRGIEKFIKKYEETGAVNRRIRSRKVTAEILEIVEEAMRCDDETSAVQLYALLRERGYEISLKIILKCHHKLGWTFRGSAYCHVTMSSLQTSALSECVLIIASAAVRKVKGHG